MKTMLLIAIAMICAHPVHAAGPRKPCADLKQEIDAKIQAKGVAGYTLEVVAIDDVGERKVIGSCDGGTRRIVYQRGPDVAPAHLAGI